MSAVWLVSATVAVWLTLMCAVVPLLARLRRTILRAADRWAES